MQKLARLQIIGPVVLFLAVFAAEGAAYALAQAPTSGFLWYLNLEVFNAFRRSRAILGDYCSLPFAQLLIVAGPLAALALAGLVWRRKLLVAVSSNLSFICAGLVLYSWNYWHTVSKVRSASLSFVHVPTGSDLYLFAALIGACLVSFVASHFLYFQALRSER